MKNATFVLILLCFSLFSTPAFTHAQGMESGGTIGAPSATSQSAEKANFVPLAPIPGLTTGIVADSAGTTGFLNNLYKYLIGIAAVLAIIEIIWAGMEIATKDSVSSKSDGKKRIWQALMGLALVLSPALVFGIINPAILNMSISMPRLDLKKYGGYTQTPVTPQQIFASDCQKKGGAIATDANGGTICKLPDNQATILSGNTIALEDCARLATSVTPYSHAVGELNSTPGVFGQAATCDSSNVPNLKTTNGYTRCKNLTGGGVCLYNP